jgi:hypothetical protein
MNQKIVKWNAALLSQFGRALVANSSILSHIWFTAQFLDYTCKNIKKLTQRLWKFMDGRGDKRCRLNYKDAIKSKLQGGLGILHVETEIAALLCYWIIRLNKDLNSN